MALPHHARPEDVAAIAANWDDDLVECRTDRHKWEKLTSEVNRPEDTWTRIRWCPNCHTEEHHMRSITTGRKVGRGKWLDYTNTVEGYLFPKGTGRMTESAIAEVWRERIGREVPAEPKRTRRSSKKAPTTKAARAAKTRKEKP